MNNKLSFTKIVDKDIYKMLEKDLDITMYDEEKDKNEDWGIGKTESTCEARLSLINGNIYLHLITKNAFAYGKENRIYSYDINKKNYCKISKIKKNISDETHDSIVNKYCNKNYSIIAFLSKNK